MTELKIEKAKLISPYGGRLVDLVAGGEERLELLELARRLPSVRLSPRALCDLELLATGAFSPLERFMGREDYERVVEDLRLADGTLFPIPITLSAQEFELAGAPDQVVLLDPNGCPLAVMQVEQVYRWDREREARRVLGANDPAHPLAAEMAGWGPLYLSGALRVIEPPDHADFPELRRTPSQARLCLEALGHEKVVAFQTRNPMHRIHEELTKRAAAAVDGSLLIHPVVGLTKPGDVDHVRRVCIYRTLVDRYYEPGRTLLSLLPLAMRLAGPREAVWHAIIRRNYGVTHFIIGRDHAGPGKDSQGNPFYGPYDAQRLLEQYAAEVGVQPVEFQELVYLADEDRYVEANRVPEGARVFSISGTQVREEYLATGKKLPEWFTRPEVAQILQVEMGTRNKEEAGSGDRNARTQKH